jgi:hypothetical protein
MIEIPLDQRVSFHISAMIANRSHEHNETPVRETLTPSGDSDTSHS